MPIHDWTRVDAGIFHAFHHDWISEIAHALNRGILPGDYYALPEQHAGRYGPDVLTLQRPVEDRDELPARSNGTSSGQGGTGVKLLTRPEIMPVGETDLEFYRRKEKVIAIRHVSGDGLVAMIEIISPGNKIARKALTSIVQKATDLLDEEIHLLIVDLHPNPKRLPNGIHGEIWEELSGEEYVAPLEKPLTLASYETTGVSVRAYVVHAKIGDSLTDMPLFLEPERAVHVPLETTYNAAFSFVPNRWLRVLEPGG